MPFSSVTENPPNASGGSDGTESENAPTLRLDSLGAGGMDVLSDAPPKKRVPLHVFMLAGLVLVAGGALFAMRKLGMGPSGAIADIQIDYDSKSPAATADHRSLRVAR